MVVIAMASSYRFYCRSYTVCLSVCPLVGKCKIVFHINVHNFQMVIIVPKTSHISYKRATSDY